MLVAILLFIAGLVLLIKGGDWFVDGSTGIAHRFNVPEVLIGATIVSIGTTLPEVLVSATSAVSGHGEIAYGNAIGSIICNTALIAAITITIKPAEVERNSLKMPVLFFFISAVFYAYTAYYAKEFDRVTGIILLSIFAIYMGISIRQAVGDLKLQRHLEATEPPEVQKKEEVEAAFGQTWKDVLKLVVGAAIIAFGANLLVENGTLIAKYMGVPESVIALTFVALGTSLPELTTAIISLSKGHGALSVGNIIGANMFNLVLVSGVSIVLQPFNLPTEKTINGINSSLVIDVPLMMIVMAIMTVPALIKGELKRWQGIILLLIYAAFCTYQFTN